MFGLYFWIFSQENILNKIWGQGVCKLKSFDTYYQMPPQKSYFCLYNTNCMKMITFDILKRYWWTILLFEFHLWILLHEDMIFQQKEISFCKSVSLSQIFPEYPQISVTFTFIWCRYCQSSGVQFYEINLHCSPNQVIMVNMECGERGVMWKTYSEIDYAETNPAYFTRL